MSRGAREPRMSRHRAGSATGPDRTTTSPDARASPRPVPGRRGLRRARRRAGLLGALRRGRADRACCCRRGRSSTRAAGRRRSPTWPATAGCSRSTGGGMAARTGRSAPSAYATDEFAADAIAVLDATDTERAVLVALSCGALWAPRSRPTHPERVPGSSSSAPRCRSRPQHPERADVPFDDALTPTRAGRSTTATTGAADYRGFLEFFFAQVFSEPHSTKQIEDCLGWALDTVARDAARRDARHRLRRTEPLARALCATRRLPGARYPRRPTIWSGRTRSGRGAGASDRRSAGHARGSGHGPHARDPVQVNLLLREFVAPAGAATSAGGRARRARGEAGAVCLVADRARTRPARCRDRR